MGATLTRTISSDSKVSSVAFSPDGTLLATGMSDNTTMLQRVADGVCMVTLAGHTNDVCSVAFSPDGMLLATCSDDKTAKLWRVSDGVCTATFAGHCDGVSSVAFSRDGMQLATGSGDKTSRLWRVADGVCTATFVGHHQKVTCVAFSPDGTLLATASSDSFAKLWRVADGECLATFTGHTNEVACVAFSPDGTLLATGSFDGTARLWRVADGVCTATLAEHDNWVTCVAFSPDGTVLAGGSANKTTKLWRVADGVCTATLVGHRIRVASVAFSPDGVMLATGSWDKLTMLWCLADGVCIATLAGHSSGVSSVAYNYGSTILASGSWDGTTKLWRVADGVCTATLAGHTSGVSSVAFSLDDTLLATGSMDGTAKLWRVADGACTATLAQHPFRVTCLAFSPDDTLLAIGSGDSTAKLCRVSDGVCIATFAEHSHQVNSVAFSPDGTLLATGSFDASCKVWRVVDGVCIATLAGPLSVRCLAFSPDGTLLAIGGGEVKVKLWRVSDGKCIVKLDENLNVNSVAFSPDGTLLAIGSTDSAIKLWRVSDGVCVATLAGHGDGVMSVAFSPDGTLLATGGGDNTAKLWRVSDGICTATLATHNTRAMCVALSSDSTLLAAGSDMGTTKIWRVLDGRCVAALGGHMLSVMCVAFSPDATLLATGGADFATKLWRVADGECTATLTGDSSAVTCVVFSPDGTHLAALRSSGMCSVWCLGNFRCVGTGSCSVGVPRLPCELEWVRLCEDAAVLEVVSGGEAVEQIDVALRNIGEPLGLTSSVLPHSKPIRIASFPRVDLAELSVGAHVSSGSSSSVFQAQWHGREYALKKYHVHVLREIERELAVVPFLRHPNIVRVVAIVRSTAMGPVIGLLMELASESLGAVLRSTSRPSTAAVLQWLHELAQAVEFAHGCGVVHSDIKPDNVMMFDAPRQQRVAKLTDFGSSCVLSTVGATATTARGTPMFIAPEYAAQETGPTKASDVFSFGMTMWCALAAPGTDHGLGRIDVQIALAVQRGRRPPLDAVDACYRPLIERCWAGEASARPSMIEVEEELRAMMEPLPAPGGGLPSFQLWASYLRHTGLESACRALQYHRHRSLYLSEPVVDAAHPCHKFVCRIAGSLSSSVERLVMVGVDDAVAGAFVTLHEAEMNSRALNAALRKEKPMDAASVAGIRRLQQSFVPAAAHDGGEPLARMLLAWHGTSYSRVVDVCRDGPRSLRTTDCGFFGAGSYFALEADYAEQYTTPDPVSNECALILFAVSVSEVKCVTPEADYRRMEDARTPQLHGFSRFYSGNRDTAVALAPGYDAHFIPVKHYGRTHPLTGASTPQDVHYQAVDEASGAAEFHELVIGSHHRCMPLAVVYLTH
jgi:WD40 repeat protein